MMKRAKGIIRAKFEYCSNVYNRQITEKNTEMCGRETKKRKGGQRCTANEQEG